MNFNKHLLKPSGLLLTAAVYSVAVFAQLPLTGGQTTTKQSGRTAFSQPAPNLPLIDKVDFSVGNSFFRNPWVIAPSSTTARDGLGPLFNANSCESCHFRDGRGHAPINAEDSATSMLIRLSIPPITDEQKAHQHRFGPIGEPTYGDQFQDGAVPSMAAEGKIKVTWTQEIFEYPDGNKVTLRKPDFELSALAYRALQPQTQQSARIAPQMIGLGLLEQIAEQDILANADEDDLNEDGISGKANWVWDVSSQTTKLGRFGWKAGLPSLQQQNASAFNGDLGITSGLFPTDQCTDAQTKCLVAPNGDTGDEKELQTDVLAAVTFYTRHIAVPKQRDHSNPIVIAGEQLFTDIGCVNCHTAKFTTPKLSDLPALSEQTFHPFSDLLLHDMGPNLADNREEFLANGQEWRTPPLWGTGYALEVSEQVALLHDGRAQSVEEAILWHGGEAETIRLRFVNLIKRQREAIIAFVNSL
ncbi:di-heme oxidoredictase family protein [Reinekea sp.]|jgi:CxxC motif-containing protein (DUF1111 family)|uniref:di-heme oxidoreductase family protein n=3 Tax=Reinekea sp. TaxID=1970455 RepID=UPI003989A68D